MAATREVPVVVRVVVRTNEKMKAKLVDILTRNAKDLVCLFVSLSQGGLFLALWTTASLFRFPSTVLCEFDFRLCCRLRGRR